MTAPDVHDPMEEGSEESAMGSRTRYAMFRLLGGMMRLPKTAVKQAFDATIGAMNPEVATHLLRSNRELLLAVRSFVDYEIRMADRALDKVHPQQSEPPKAQEMQKPLDYPPDPQL